LNVVDPTRNDLVVFSHRKDLWSDLSSCLSTVLSLQGFKRTVAVLQQSDFFQEVASDTFKKYSGKIFIRLV
jgi:hypothetical protein